MRARNLKPGLFKNEHLAECSALARFLFPGLWCMADREGRLEDRPLRIKAELLPYDDCDVDELLKELAQQGFVRRYAVDQLAIIEVVNFRRHQLPHRNETASQLPPCTDKGQDNSGNGPKDFGSFAKPAPTQVAPRQSPSNRSLMQRSLPLTDEESPPVTGPVAAKSTVDDPGVLEFPTKGPGGNVWVLRQSKLDQYRTSYPDLDVIAECRKARQWCIDNQAKQKTSGGMPKFLTNWLNGAQNRGQGVSYARNPLGSDNPSRVRAQPGKYAGIGTTIDGSMPSASAQ